MHLPQKFNSRRGLFLVGMAALLLANLVHYFGRAGSSSWFDTSDAIMGLFYGIAIGLLLLSLRRKRMSC